MNWLKQIDKISANFQSTFGHLSELELNIKPDNESWSIAQNIDHLIKINNTYLPILKELEEGNYKAPLHAKLGFIVNLFGRFILNSVHPSRQNKIKTFQLWEPSKSNISGDILERFFAHQNILKNKITEAQNHIDNQIVISSPANKLIVYKLSTAFDIIVTHEQRHYNQAFEVLTFIQSKR